MTINWYLDEIKKRTGGRVVYKEYWGGALAQTALESWALLRQGAVDLTAIAPVTTAPEVFRWDVPLNAFGGVFKTPQEALRITRLTYDEQPILQKQWEGQGVMWAIPNMTGPYNINSKSPLKTFADFKGKKIYVTNRYVALWLQGSGAVPVSIAVVAEQYDALRSGLLDGMWKPLDFVYANKFWEVAPYYTYAGFGSVYAAPWAVNLQKYNSLPDDIKKIMNDLWREVDDMNIYYYETLQKEASDFLQAKLTYFQLSKEDLAKWEAGYGGIEGLAKEWLDTMEKQNVPRSEALKFLQHIQERAAPGWVTANPEYAPDWVYKSPITGKTIPRIFPLTP